MFRVAFLVLLTMGLAGCGFNAGPALMGFGDADSSAALAPSGNGGLALEGTPAVSPAAFSPREAAPQLARVEDKAPSGSFEQAPKGALSGRDYSTTALDLDKARELVNQYRRSKGLKPLTLNAALTAAAKDHARDLARWDRISHFGSDGSNPWDRVKRTGYNPRLTGENVGTGHASFEEVLKGWKDSPGHNKNLLMRDAQNMGIALVQDPKTEFKSFWTLVIGAAL